MLPTVNRVARWALRATSAFLLIGTDAFAQGCEPIRFTIPISGGGQGQSYLNEHDWRITLGYRRLDADEWFVGSEIRNDLSLMKTAPVVSLNTVVIDVAYSLSARTTLRVSVPYATGRLTRLWADSARHSQRVSGIGDISLAGQYWLFDPRWHPNGNVALGLGVKAPTGDHKVASTFFTAQGPIPFAADQSIQLGDGGWGITVQAEAFKHIYERAFLYAAGSYLFNPRARTDVVPQPNYGTTWSVPDNFNARLGMTYSLTAEPGISVSMGGRVDGLPVHDVFGAGDDAARRPGYVIYADPGVAVSRGRDIYTVGVPVRLYAKRLKSVWEQQKGLTAGGDFAKFLIFAGYSRQF